MDDYDLAYMPEGSERKFDLTIPILLLILVLFVVAWKVGWLANIPGVGNILGGKTTSILLVGNDLSLKTNLEELATEININYNVITKEDIDDIRNVDYLNKYDIVILTEYLDTTKPMELPGTFRAYLSKYLEGGKKLVLYKLVGARDPDEPQMSGWATAGMSSYIPVYCPTADQVCDYTENIFKFTLPDTSLKIYSEGAGHPITDGYTLTINFATDTTDVDAAIINAKSGASKLVAIEDEATGTSNPAIVETGFGMGGKTIYFAYHPSQTPTLFKNAIKYLMGGGQ